MARSADPAGGPSCQGGASHNPRELRAWEVSFPYMTFPISAQLTTLQVLIMGAFAVTCTATTLQ